MPRDFFLQFALVLLCLFCILTAACSSGACSDQPVDPTRGGIAELRLGMSRTHVVCVLGELDADDFSSEMSVLIPQSGSPDDLKEWMWSVPEYGVNLETLFQDDKLIELNVWDATKPNTTYHHLMEHARIDRITFGIGDRGYDIEIVQLIPGE